MIPRNELCKHCRSWVGTSKGEINCACVDEEKRTITTCDYTESKGCWKCPKTRMTKDKKEFIEAMLTWFRSPKVGNDEELDRKFLSSAYDNITQPHWISVEEELPPKGQWVLCFTKSDSEINTLRYDIYNWKGICFTVSLDDITHWMPMPQAPYHIIDANKKVEHLRETTKMIEKGGEK